MTRATVRRLGVVTAALALVASACGRNDDQAAPEVPRASLLPATTVGATAAPQPGTTVAVHPPTTPLPSSSTTASTTPPPGAAPPAAAPGAPHPVGSTIVKLVDTTRPTVSRGRTIAPNRTLTTTIYSPTDGGGPYPLVVFAHGFQIGPGPYAHLCQVLAAAGYVVAAPAFPLTDQDVAGANLDRGDLPNQAGDVGFVISSLAFSPPGGVRIDDAHIGVVGHSDGADTALDVGYFPGRNDSRVKAIAAFSPDAMTGAGGSVGGGVPLLLEHGDRDTIVPFSNSQTVFGQVRAHRLFLVMHGADHLPPVQGVAPWAPVLEQTTVAFLDRYVAGRTSTDDGIVGAAGAGGSSVAAGTAAG